MHLLERLPRETSRDYALRTLQDNIIRLELVPGSMVSENELATEMGLSRTPVREALVELAKVKVVEIYPQRGSLVVLIDYAMVEEARFMRNVLEREVVKLVCQKATEKELHLLQENVRLHSFYLQHGDPDILLQTDNEFHRILFQIAKKEQIHTLMQSLAIHFDRVRRMSFMVVKDVKIIADHQAILDAIMERNEESASEQMEIHLSRYKIDQQQIRREYPQYIK